jgi:hypothetical protein
MRSVNEGFEILGPAVTRIGSVWQDSVKTSIPPAGEFRDGHNLDGRHAEAGEMIKFAYRGGKCALGSECADV